MPSPRRHHYFPGTAIGIYYSSHVGTRDYCKQKRMSLLLALSVARVQRGSAWKNSPRASGQFHVQTFLCSFFNIYFLSPGLAKCTGWRSTIIPALSPRQHNTAFPGQHSKGLGSEVGWSQTIWRTAQLGTRLFLQFQAPEDSSDQLQYLTSGCGPGRFLWKH